MLDPIITQKENNIKSVFPHIIWYDKKHNSIGKKGHFCMEKSIFEQEHLHLEEVKQKIVVELRAEQQTLDNQQAELVKKRREMWDECAHGVADFDDIVDMNSYDENVREEYGHFVRKEEAVRQLEYLKNTPYFGRIDFVEDGELKPEEIYIGRYGFRNKKTREYEVYDWRTPIASMFYDCSIGAAAYRCPAGKIQGELTCKRQYKIEKGVLQYCYDTNIAVQDEFLGEVLAENTDKVLRVIIDTITREQNQAIRQSESKDLLITGPAGSGKTSVGMHRLAYLLYHNRTNLTSEKIVSLARNQIFSSYISGILPELGEENVNDVMFDDLVIRGISREYKKNGYYEQVEYLLKHTEDTIRKRGIYLKYSKDFLEYIREKLKNRPGGKTDFPAAMEIYLELLKQYCAQREINIYHHTRTNLRREKLYYEDILVIAFIRILIGGIRPMSEISHVVIDEAQDYCNLQLTIIKELYPKSRFTILADENQAIDELVSTVDMKVFKDIFGNGMERIRLGKSYRSTAQINRFAFAILDIHNSDLYVDRHGKDPEFLTCDNMGESVYELLEQIPKDKSVGILTCDLDSSQRAKRWLSSIQETAEGAMESENRKIQYLLRPEHVLEEKIVVMPIMLAKGLEFDVVIVWDDRDEEYWQEHKNLKYLMCTRALHELYFVQSSLETQ